MTVTNLYLYLRVSTDQQLEDGFGILNQKELGLKVSKRLGFNPIVINEGSKSSSGDDISDRPELVRLLNLVEDGIVKNLWVFAVDRLSRNSLTSAIIREKLKKNGVKLYVKEGTSFDLSDPNDELIQSILERFSIFDNQIRTDRLRRGRLSSIKNGGWKGGVSPFGYSLSNKKIVINPNESKWVETIYKMYSDGKSIYQIRKTLMENNVLSKRGNLLFSEGSIRKILDNTVYEGFYFYSDKKLNETIRVPTPIIITDKVILSSVRRRSKNSIQKGNNTKRQTLLKPYLKCYHCGSNFGQKINKKQYYNHYYCRGNETHKRNSIDGKKLCFIENRVDKLRVRSLNIEDTDNLIWEETLDVLSNSILFKEQFKGKTLHSRKLNSDVGLKDKTKIKRQIKNLQKKVIDYNDLINNHLVNELLSRDKEDQYKNLSIKIENEKRNVELQIEELENRLVIQKQSSVWNDWYSKFYKQIDDLKKSDIGFDDKKRFLEGIVESIVVTTIDNHTHKLNIQFKTPYVGDKLQYNDETNKSLGYTCIGGSKEKIVTLNTMNKKLNTDKSLDKKKE
jgi:site-specific DNA recombinase